MMLVIEVKSARNPKASGAGHWNTLFSGGCGLTRNPFWCEGMRRNRGGGAIRERMDTNRSFHVG